VSAFKLQEAEEPESRRLSQITLPAAYHDLYRWKLRQEDGVKNSLMFILAFAFLVLLAPRSFLSPQPAPILPDPKLTPGDSFPVNDHSRRFLPVSI
jgi:hypothetical protein